MDAYSTRTKAPYVGFLSPDFEQSQRDAAPGRCRDGRLQRTLYVGLWCA